MSNNNHFSEETRFALAYGVAQWNWAIGEHSYGKPTILEAGIASLAIGRFCSIGPNVAIALGDHRIDLVSTYPFATLRGHWPSAPSDVNDHHTKGGVSIGSDVWIGAGASILSGVNVGSGAVIAAGSVVREDVPAYAVVAGVPAKIVKFRFKHDIIARLCELAWWDWPDELVRQRLTDIVSSDVEKFVTKYSEVNSGDVKQDNENMFVYQSASNLLSLIYRTVTVGDPPPEIDLKFYRELHNDLFKLNDEELLDRYMTIDRSSGRIASPGAYRGGLIGSIPQDELILEIGPYTRPTFRGPNIRYFDLADAEQLTARAVREGMPVEGCPYIDYVSPTADLSIVESDSFNIVFSSHCIEHQPDLVTHLHQVSRILREGGRYYLAIPDKRYCFDHFIAETSTEDVVRAYDEKRLVHSLLSVFRYFVDTTHNDPIRHWAGDHGPSEREDRAERARQAVELFEGSKGQYIDVHAWQLTPTTFRSILNELFARGLTDLTVERVYDTVFHQNEFMAVLRKGNPPAKQRASKVEFSRQDDRGDFDEDEQI